MITWNLQYFAEKTEPATAKKRGELRGKGQVARSMDLTMAISLLAFLVGLKIFGGGLLNALFVSMQMLLTDGIMHASAGTGITAIVMTVLKQVLYALLPLIIVGFIAGVIASVAQTGIVFTPNVLVPDLTRLNPISGFQRFFSLNSFAELLKSTLKVVIIGIVIYIVLSGIISQMYQMNQADPTYILEFYIQNALKLMFAVAGIYAAIALLDLLYQRFSFERNIRMSKDEIKDEMKQAEGNPQIKGKIRQQGRAIAFRRMMRNVPKADVIITNPTHYAVALRYDAMTMHAPQLVAKGVDNIALRIKEIAAENDVPIVENRQLARTIYQVVELDDYIPGSLFAAVAEVLAYVYRLRGRLQR